MNKILSLFKTTLLSLILLFSIAPVGLVYAENVLDPVCKVYAKNDPNAPTICQDNKTQTIDDNAFFGPNGIFTKIISLLSMVIGVVAIIMIIVGGLKYVLSNGDANSINSAKNTILYAIIGLVISVIAQGIITFVIKRL